MGCLGSSEQKAEVVRVIPDVFGSAFLVAVPVLVGGVIAVLAVVVIRGRGAAGAAYGQLGRGRRRRRLGVISVFAMVASDDVAAGSSTLLALTGAKGEQPERAAPILSHDQVNWMG